MSDFKQLDPNDPTTILLTRAGFEEVIMGLGVQRPSIEELAEAAGSMEALATRGIGVGLARWADRKLRHAVIHRTLVFDIYVAGESFTLGRDRQLVPLAKLERAITGTIDGVQDLPAIMKWAATHPVPGDSWMVDQYINGEEHNDVAVIVARMDG